MFGTTRIDCDVTYVWILMACREEVPQPKGAADAAAAAVADPLWQPAYL